MPQLRHPPRSFHTLTRASAMPAWVSIGWRVAAVLGLIGIAITVHWFDRAGLRDIYDGHVSFIDVVYFTMISITTTGYGDIVPISDRARLFDALVVTPIRVFVILIFLGTAYSFVIRRTWDTWRMKQIQKMLTNHIVVAGFGTSGSEAVRELIARGTPANELVVIDRSEDQLSEAAALGCNVLRGDASNDDTLIDVRVANARAAIVSAGRDDSSILIVLTIRHLAPDIPISVVVRAADNELLARQAGANTVINPVSFAGLLLAGSTHGEHIADYLADLASENGRVKLVEHKATPAEIGRTLSELRPRMIVRIYRGKESIGFQRAEHETLREGDSMVEIVGRDPASA